MLELHIKDSDVTSGSIPIAWCIDKTLRDKLASEEIKDPAIVVFVYPEAKLEVGYDDLEYRSHQTYKEQRFVFRLTDLMGYIHFRYPGKNNIVAFVAKSYKRAMDYYLTKCGKEYENNIISRDSTQINPNWNDEFYDTIYEKYLDEDNGEHKKIVSKTKIDNISEVISVDVPSYCFAKEPPEWEKTWVNHLFTYKAIDQCDFRKRRLFAYTIQPIWLMFNILIRILPFIIALLIGARNISLKPIIHPLTYDIDESLGIVKGGTFFVSRKTNKWYRYITVPLMPLFLIPICMLLYFGVLLKVLMWTLLVMIGIAFVIAVCGFAPKVWERIIYGAPDESWYLDEDEMRRIICDGQEKPKKISELPSKRRTFRLRFSDIKSKVCKPFAG